MHDQECSVSFFVEKRKLFVTKLSSEEFNLVFVTAERSVLKQPRRHNFQYIPSLLYGQEKYLFYRGIFVFIKVPYTFCTF